MKKINTVQDLINELNLIEDKTIAFSGYLIKENSSQRKEIFLLNNALLKK